MRIIILFNPTAKRGKARRLLERALEVFRQQHVHFVVRESQSAQHLMELAREAREEKPDLIVSAGGDGTHHYVINGLFKSEIPLGLLPLGTGNDFAKGVGMPMELHTAAAALLNGHVREIDLAQAGSAIYGCIAGVGFDSTVTRYANEHARWLSGSLAYMWSLLWCLPEYRPQQLEIIADGESFSGDVVFAVVGNNASYGGGIRLAPRAKLDDGLLDICIIPYMSRLELLRWVPRAYRGEHLNHPRIKYLQARKITLCAPSRMELFGDGEFLQELPATIEVIPRALRVIAPGY
ncbi:MAG: diacylglycerol kinase family protein [Terriglobia bacterium]